MSGPCDACQRHAGKLYVAASAFGPVSFAYCEPCVSGGVEPYGALVGGLFGAGLDAALAEIPPDLHPIIDASLAVAGKTRDDLVRDCAEAWAEYDRATS